MCGEGGTGGGFSHCRLGEKGGGVIRRVGQVGAWQQDAGGEALGMLVQSWVIRILSNKNKGGSLTCTVPGRHAPAAASPATAAAAGPAQHAACPTRHV